MIHRIKLLFLLLIPAFAMATHNRAGEITYKHIEGNTYEITVTTYTHSKNTGPDRPVILVDWGDGTSNEINRLSQERIGNETFHNIYKTRHTYRGSGEFLITFKDPNRVEDIINMNESVNTPFFLQSKIYIKPSLQSKNNSVQLLQPPIDFACVGELFNHNPGAYDVDGDSLTFKIIPPFKERATTVDGYYKPYSTDFFRIDKNTGQLTWKYPDSQGIYNIAIEISEWRNEELVGVVVRDMQIFVRTCKNNPPKIDPLKDTCIEAGSTFTLNLLVNATDTDFLDRVTLTAKGGPFVLNGTQAQFPQNTSGLNKVMAQFSWTVECSHIRKEPFQVIFKAEDNHDPVPLSDIEPINIRVVGPAPENLKADPRPQGIFLDWELPKCTNIKGYKVFRKIDTSFWDPSYCEIGVPAYTGFRNIATIHDTVSNYFDRSALPGAIYCYRVTAFYREEGNFEPVQGYSSGEVCARLQKDIPVITHVDILSTDTGSGKIFMDFSKPYELDSSQYEPPYKYEIYHYRGFTPSGKGTLVKTIGPYNTFSELISPTSDTTLYDSMLNTQDNPNGYFIKFYAEDSFLVGSAPPTSSVFLEISSTHKALILTWESNTVWVNDKYVVFKLDTLTDNFFVLDTVEEARYKDTGLVNGENYCYFIRSIGDFSAPGFVSPIINNSQEVCAAPRDTFPPCPPVLEAKANCTAKTNLLNWTYDFSCDSDAVRYNIYYRPNRGSRHYYVGTNKGDSNWVFTDSRDTLKRSLAGCYIVTAIDSYGNESDPSNEECVDNCPAYKLPNVFTPNGDGYNDQFRPLDGWQFIDKIHIKIYNRWGQLVFETTDPMIKWSGLDKNSGEKLPAGTYFYEITIFEEYLDKVESREQTGTITLIR